MNCTDRNSLIQGHLALVQKVVRSFYGVLPSHVDRSELESAGYLGLVDAAGKFDVSKHVQFKSYAQFRIRGAIVDFLRSTDWGPRQLRRQGREIERLMQTLSQRLGRTAMEAEVAAELGIGVEAYREMLSDLHSLELGSLNAEMSEDSGEELLAYLAGPEEEEPLFQILRCEVSQHLQEAIENLPERERLVIALSYAEELSLKEIGLALGLSESRVSQLRTNAVAQLRSMLSAVVPPSKAVKRTSGHQTLRCRVAA